MVIRLQCWMRQCIARMDVSLRLNHRDEIAARLMEAMYRGWKGREEARRKRVDEMTAAAVVVQTVYRGRLGMIWFRLFKAQLREAKTRFLQRVYRGMRGRVLANAQRARLAVAVEALHAFEEEYRAGTIVARVTELLERDTMVGLGWKPIKGSKAGTQEENERAAGEDAEARPDSPKAADEEGGAGEGDEEEDAFESDSSVTDSEVRWGIRESVRSG